MKMSLVVKDMKALMKSPVNFDDKLHMAKLCHRTGKDKEIFNEESKMHKNDSSFERHVQWKAEVAIQYSLNMFDNHDEKHPEKLDEVWERIISRLCRGQGEVDPGGAGGFCQPIQPGQGAEVL